MHRKGRILFSRCFAHVFEFRQKGDIFIVPSVFLFVGKKLGKRGRGEGGEDLLKGDLFIGDTNLGVGNVVKGGILYRCCAIFSLRGRILLKERPILLFVVDIFTRKGRKNFDIRLYFFFFFIVSQLFILSHFLQHYIGYLYFQFNRTI